MSAYPIHPSLLTGLLLLILAQFFEQDFWFERFQDVVVHAGVAYVAHLAVKHGGG